MELSVEVLGSVEYVADNLDLIFAEIAVYMASGAERVLRLRQCAVRVHAQALSFNSEFSLGHKLSDGLIGKVKKHGSIS